ncbi:MAG: S-layer homology domain-containing protein [Clostridia bacterium]|nr:S-layer homology domain-containing protein [Clostridia bacterium]
MKKIICIVLTFMMLTSSLTFVYASEEDREVYVYRNNTYDFSICPDPMHVTDEDFFGEWDADREVWIQEPDFNYEKYEGLKLVESAAKAGDYETAKEELMAYYVPQKYNKVKDNAQASTSNLLESEKMARNFYATNYTGRSIEILGGVNEQWNRITSKNVLTHVKSAVADGNPYVAFVIASIDKSNTAAEIKSRDTDEPPVLNLVVNNVQMSFTACADSYISPNLNSKTNYGNEEILYAQEYGYVGHWDDFTAPWGMEASDTKRTYIKFDLSSIASTAKISSATFDFTARVAPGGDLKEKELFIFGWQDASWEENSLTWDSFTDWLFFSANEQEAWSYITSDSTTKKGKMCFYHRGGLANPPAIMYDATGDEKYAYTFIRQMMSLIYNVGVNPDVMNALDTSNHIATIGDAFIRCWGSETLTPEYFTAFLKHLTRMTDFMCNQYLERETHWNNWATNQTRSSYWACMKFPEFKNADFWYYCTTKHNLRLYDYGIFEDGVSIEQGLGYVETWLGTVGGAIGVSESVKYPEYGPFCDEAGQQILLSIVKNLYYSTGPNYTGFNFSDSMDHGVSYQSLIAKWYNYLLDMGIDDPELAYVATNGKRGVLPSFTSISFPDAKRTYMRTDWSKDAISIGITAKGGGVSHRHHDVLSLAMFAYGQYLLIDSSYGAVLTGEIFDYMKSPDQHNTITLNDGNMNTGADYDSVVKELEINDIHNYVNYGFGGIKYTSNTERSVLFPKGQKFIIVTDYIVPENNEITNTVNQNWHMLPNSGLYLTDDGKQEFRSAFISGANVIVAPVDSDSLYSATIEDTKYAPASGSFINNHKGVYRKKIKGPGVMNTVIYPTEAGSDKKIDTTVIDTGIENNGATAFRLLVTDKQTSETETYFYYHLNDVTKKKNVTIGKYTTDATTMLVQENEYGDVTSLFVYDGTFVEKNDIKDKYLFKSNVGNKVISISMDSGNFVEIATEDNDISILENITVYTGFDVHAATFNGDRVNSVKKDGPYVFFSEVPLINSTEENPDKNDDDKNSGFGNFGGGSGSGGSGSGGGGGGGSVTPSVKDEEENKPEVEPEVIPSVPEVVIPTYNDVTESDWYYSYVTELSSKNIVSGDGTGNFAPNDNVTREQFLKMLFEAADVQVDEAENTFTDVADAWYKSYVLKAKNFGIVNGISDTEFGIGSNITRQDMAVMITRMFEAKNLEISDAAAEDFSDADIVSDYAKKSVNFMKAIGLIEGYDNLYRPLDNLTRAEAAKVIYGFIEYLNK